MRVVIFGCTSLLDGREESESGVERESDNPQESQTIYLFSHVFWVVFLH